MKYPDYKVQVLKERSQWESGLLSRLKLDEDGLGLFSTPNFQTWLKLSPPGGRRPGRALATDDCGRIVWIESPSEGSRSTEPLSLWVHDPANGLYDRLTRLDPLTGGGPEVMTPSKLWVTESAIWIFDSVNRRILGLRSETLQLIRAIPIEKALDVVFDGDALFYTLEDQDGAYAVGRYDPRYTKGGDLPRWRCSGCDGSSAWDRPVGLAVNAEGAWVLDAGTPGGGSYLHQVRSSDDCRSIRIPRRPAGADCPDGPLQSIDADLAPTGIAADCQGNLLVALHPAEIDDAARASLRRRALECGQPTPEESSVAQLVQFDPSGGLLGQIRLPSKPAPLGAVRAETRISSIRAIVPGTDGGLLLLTDLGLASFALEHVPVGESGTYYSRTLDNGLEGGAWHRLAIGAELPPGTQLRIWACASDDAELGKAIDEIVDASGRVARRRSEIESRLGAKWVPVGDLHGSTDQDAASAEAVPAVKRRASPANLEHDVLFTTNHRGRYLWLKISLASYDEGSRPSLREFQIFHPRESYLRYLPATFQEVPGDPSAESPARDFLERFLSLFETRLWELDVEIDNLFSYFDPLGVPREFLPWLGRWLNLGVEEDWEEERTRQLIRHAWRLYDKKGTPAGIAEMIQVVTQRQAEIVEVGRLLQPVPLGTQWRLGGNTYVRRHPPPGLKLGAGLRLGSVPVGGSLRDAADPFGSSAHRFIVLVYGDVEGSERDSALIRRLVDEHKPAHTEYTLRLVDDGAMGTGLRVGVNTRLTRAGPLKLGRNTSIGRAIAISRHPPAATIGSATRLKRGFELI